MSTREQNPEAQEAELRAAGATRVFVDRGESSRVKDRPQWIACLDYLRSGDTLLVRRLDRMIFLDDDREIQDAEVGTAPDDPDFTKIAPIKDGIRLQKFLNLEESAGREFQD